MYKAYLPCRGRKAKGTMICALEVRGRPEVEHCGERVLKGLQMSVSLAWSWVSTYIHAFAFSLSFKRYHFISLWCWGLNRVLFLSHVHTSVKGMAILGDRACCLLLFVLVGYLKRWFSNGLVCTGGSHTAGTIRTQAPPS